MKGLNRMVSCIPERPSLNGNTGIGLAAMRTAQKIDSGNIVVVFPDRAEKYLSTKMFERFE